MSAKTKKSSMRNTPVNKMRRISKDMINLEESLLRVEGEIELAEEGSDHHSRLVFKKGGIERHMKELKSSLAAWSKQR
jgi:hypothetical protein